MILDTLFRKRRLDTPAGLIYGALVAQARDPWFYGELGVPDTVEGRFEMIALHGFVVLNRLKLEKRDGSPLAEQLGQAIFDLMFADMDRNLREMGVGDLGIAKRVKALIKGFYGRIKAYEEGLSGVDGLLIEALSRNVFAGEAGNGAAQALASYLQDSVARLGEVPLEAMMGGRLAFARPSVAVGGPDE
jgi:cytochrome b pre-mRNA-processing protein 3